MNSEQYQELLVAAKRVLEQHRQYKKGCVCPQCKLQEIVDKHETKTV